MLITNLFGRPFDVDENPAVSLKAIAAFQAIVFGWLSFPLSHMKSRYKK